MDGWKDVVRDGSKGNSSGEAEPAIPDVENGVESINGGENIPKARRIEGDYKMASMEGRSPGTQRLFQAGRSWVTEGSADGRSPE